MDKRYRVEWYEVDEDGFTPGSEEGWFGFDDLDKALRYASAIAERDVEGGRCVEVGHKALRRTVYEVYDFERDEIAYIFDPVDRCPRLKQLELRARIGGRDLVELVTGYVERAYEVETRCGWLVACEVSGSKLPGAPLRVYYTPRPGHDDFRLPSTVVDNPDLPAWFDAFDARKAGDVEAEAIANAFNDYA